MPNDWHAPTNTVMRRLVTTVADKHGIPRKQTRVVQRTGLPNNGCFGYVRVFRGPGTKAERALFKRVYRTATTIDVSSVKALAPSEPEFAFDPEAR